MYTMYTNNVHDKLLICNSSSNKGFLFRLNFCVWGKIKMLWLSKPQPNLNTTVGFDNKMTLSGWHLSMQHLSSLHLYISGISQLLLTRFWWNFTGRFLEQIPTVTVTFVQATFVLVIFVHIRNISAVTDTILTKLWRQGQQQQNKLNIIGFWPHRN